MKELLGKGIWHQILAQSCPTFLREHVRQECANFCAIWPLVNQWGLAFSVICCLMIFQMRTTIQIFFHPEKNKPFIKIYLDDVVTKWIKNTLSKFLRLFTFFLNGNLQKCIMSLSELVRIYVIFKLAIQSWKSYIVDKSQILRVSL